MVTLTTHQSKYKVHKLKGTQRYFLANFNEDVLLVEFIHMYLVVVFTTSMPGETESYHRSLRSLLLQFV